MSPEASPAQMKNVLAICIDQIIRQYLAYLGPPTLVQVNSSGESSPVKLPSRPNQLPKTQLSEQDPPSPAGLPSCKYNTRCPAEFEFQTTDNFVCEYVPNIAWDILTLKNCFLW